MFKIKTCFLITGTVKDHTGFGLFVENINKKLELFIYNSVNVPDNLHYSTAEGSFSAQAWLYFGIVYDFDQGKSKENINVIDHT
jgi:hypothetical protein